jgi:hypothetical protein
VTIVPVEIWSRGKMFYGGDDRLICNLNYSWHIRYNAIFISSLALSNLSAVTIYLARLHDIYCSVATSHQYFGNTVFQTETPHCDRVDVVEGTDSPSGTSKWGKMKTRYIGTRLVTFDIPSHCYIFVIIINASFFLYIQKCSIITVILYFFLIKLVA